MYDQNEQGQIEVTIEELKAQVAKLEVVVKLSDDPNFKKAITEGYLKDEAVRLVGLLADPSVVCDPDAHKDVINQMHGVAYLRRYLSFAHRQHAQLQRELESHLEEAATQAQEEAGEAGSTIIG